MRGRAHSPAALAIRFGLVIAAFVLLGLMDGAIQAFRERYSATLQPDVGLWLGAEAFGILAGAAIAAAGWYGAWSGTYRIDRVLLVAAIPLVILVLSTLFVVGAHDALPSFVEQLSVRFPFLTSPFQLLPAVLVGVAAVAGATGKD
jgi:hypothetical protein